MNKFVRNLLTEWRKLKLPFENETIIVAVSGGADSLSLTIALADLRKRKKLNLSFIVAHFNHNLRGTESDKDAEFVKDLAEKLNFEFAYKIQNPKSKIQNQSGNLEQNARNARYDFFNQVAATYDAYAILTAHTKNDQAETLLFNLIRGSGLDGLAGMRPIRNQDDFLLVRPLLNWASREETESFCIENKFVFCQDSMNEDVKFSRVLIRKEIIPLLKKINPKIIDSLSQTANLLQEDAASLQIDIEKLPEILSQSELKEMTKPKRMSVLRAWLKKMRGDLRQLNLKHFESLENLIFSRKSGRFVELPNYERVVKKEGKIFFEKSRVEKSCSDN